VSGNQTRDPSAHYRNVHQFHEDPITDNSIHYNIGYNVSAMKLSEGVEWSCHVCAVLAGVPQGMALPSSALAAFHELPPAYMAKHLQALSRAGIVHSVRGVSGGYRLARPANEVSLWDIRQAIEGGTPDFRCRNIRRNGPCSEFSASSRPCAVAAAFWAAERSYQQSLQVVTVANIARGVAKLYGPKGTARFLTWIKEVS
jgi:Rrf2 family protein